jgi:hypothetical protein
MRRKLGNPTRVKQDWFHKKLLLTRDFGVLPAPAHGCDLGRVRPIVRISLFFLTPAGSQRLASSACRRLLIPTYPRWQPFSALPSVRGVNRKSLGGLQQGQNQGDAATCRIRVLLCEESIGFAGDRLSLAAEQQGRAEVVRT